MVSATTATTIRILKAILFGLGVIFLLVMLVGMAMLVDVQSRKPAMMDVFSELSMKVVDKQYQIIEMNKDLETFQEKHALCAVERENLDEQLTERDVEIGRLSEQKLIAESRADTQLAESRRQQELARMKTEEVENVSEELNTCENYLRAGVELADTLDTQKSYYREASALLSSSAIEIIDGNLQTAQAQLDTATAYVLSAEKLEPSVDSLLGNFR